MDTSLNAPRDTALEIILSSAGVQNALDSAKHGTSKAEPEEQKTSAFVAMLQPRSLLYAGTGIGKTIAITENTSITLERFKWYSLCTVTMKDLNPDIAPEGVDGLRMTIQMVYLRLFVITPEDLVTAIQLTYGRSSAVRSSWIEDEGTPDMKFCLVLDVAGYGICSKIIRKTELDCYPKDWEIRMDKDTAYTSFRGNKFFGAHRNCTAVISTDIQFMVKQMGRLGFLHTYMKYMDNDADIPFLLSTMFGKDGDAEVETSSFTNVGILEAPLKSLCMRNQYKTLVTLCGRKSRDELRSAESAIIAGKQLKDTE